MFALQNGDILHEDEYLSHKEYCLKASLNEETNRPDLELLVCFESSDDLDIRYQILPWGMHFRSNFFIKFQNLNEANFFLDS